MSQTIPSHEPAPPNDVFSPGCPARTVLDMLAEKWALLLIHALIAGPARPSELRSQVGGISEKMLIQTIRKLERGGLVHRRTFPEVPPRGVYSLTELGASLGDLVRGLDEWVERHAVQIDDARRDHQARTDEAPVA